MSKLTDLVGRSAKVLKPLFFLPILISIVFINYGFEWSLGGAPSSGGEQNTSSSSTNNYDLDESVTSRHVSVVERSEKRQLADEEAEALAQVESLVEQAKVPKGVPRLPVQPETDMNFQELTAPQKITEVSRAKTEIPEPLKLLKNTRVNRKNYNVQNFSGALGAYRNSRQVLAGISNNGRNTNIDRAIVAQKEASMVTKSLSTQVYKSTEKAKYNQQLLQELENVRSDNLAYNYSSLNGILELERLRLTKDSVNKNSVNFSDVLSSIKVAEEAIEEAKKKKAEQESEEKSEEEFDF